MIYKRLFAAQRAASLRCSMIISGWRCRSTPAKQGLATLTGSIAEFSRPPATCTALASVPATASMPYQNGTISMFERNKPQTELGAVSVELLIEDGLKVSGRLIVPAGRALFEVLNGPQTFLEFEPFDGERRYIAKSAVKAVKLLGGVAVSSLSQRVRDLDGFDPYSVLGIVKGSPADEIRSAYVTMARQYHPDRFTAVELPSEISNYLEGMSRRVNAAYEALEPVISAEKLRGHRAEPIYVSRVR